MLSSIGFCNGADRMTNKNCGNCKFRKYNVITNKCWLCVVSGMKPNWEPIE